MSTKKPKPNKNKIFSRPLVLATLMAGGILQPYLPALAGGTVPGTISNTATAEYTNDLDQPFAATSNTVEVTVAEVAGLSVTPAGIKDEDGGAVQAGDIVDFDFKVTNTGNSPTDIFIPALADIHAENFTPTAVEVYLVNPDGSIATTPTALVNGAIPNVTPDQSYIVRVVGTVPTSGLSAGADIKVTLGDTLPNDNSPATQNQPDAGPAGDAQPKDVRTQNIGPDASINGEREASATQSVKFATEIKPLALATVRKNAATVKANSAVNTDDQITYALSLTVENTSPSGAFSPEKLAATDIKLEGGTTKRVLVSDIIPAGTVFDPSITPTVPSSDWTVVYSTDDPATTVPVGTTTTPSDELPAANWTATPPAAASIKRIGYIASGPLDKTGVAITGFKFTVVTSNLPAAGGPVFNIAQVFGQTYDDPTNPVNPTTEIVYDESGDNNPNNFNDNQTPPDSTGSNFDPATDTGVPNPTVDGIDPTNTPANDGVGPDGEDTKVNIGSTPTTNEDIYNGPSGKPNATGATDFNDDFTNVSASVPAGTQNAFDPAPVTTSHTVQNPGTNSVALSNVTIEPISPKQAEGADPNSTAGKFGANTDIPDGTKVTISYTDVNSVTQVAHYTYDSALGIFKIDAGDKPVNVGELVPGRSVDYTVTVDMPLDANLTKPLADIPIPILAFSDDDPVTSPGYNDTLNVVAGIAPGSAGYKAPELNNNVTNDHVYLGYMELIKEARILDAAGSVKEDWKTALTEKALPGDVIEYRIMYKNISSPMQGSGNVVLNAKNFMILEDGAAAAVGNAPANNWATSTNHQPTTLFDKGTVEYFQGTGSATSLGMVDPAAGSQVGTYVNAVGDVSPNESGKFVFRRQVNN
jgi:hypothetical protein